MSALTRVIERFCVRHPRWGIPRLFMWIVGGNLLVFLLMHVVVGVNIVAYLYFDPRLILQGQVWRLITWLFIPEVGAYPQIRDLLFFAISLYFYMWLARTLEGMWGQAKFTLFFTSGVLLSLIYCFGCYVIYQNSPLSYLLIVLNPSYLELSMFLAVAIYFSDMTIRLFYVIPIKMKWLALVYLGLMAFNMITTRGPLRFISLVGILNVGIFCYEELLEIFRRLRRSGSFRRKVQWEQKTRGFTADVQNSTSFSERKCAVCGKLASEHPESEFRYCSRCEGLHCFCEEHISSHVHFKK